MAEVKTSNSGRRYVEIDEVIKHRLAPSTPPGYPSDEALKAAQKLVTEWDTDNAVCLLGDHEWDLVFRIAQLLASE